MLDSWSANGTVAKIKYIYGRMFTKENYHEMLMRRTVPEAADYLAHSARYKDAFRDVDPNTVHRGFVEELLQRENFNTYMRLCRFQELDKLPFYDFLIKSKEIECILSMINNINSGLDNSYLNDLPGYVIKHSKVSLLEMSRAENFEQLLKILRNTPYYKILVKIPPLEDGSADYTECELRLRTAYYAELLNTAKHDFSEMQSKQLSEMIGREIDCLNIINAYRMKAFFGYSPEEIKKRQIRIKTGTGSVKRLDKYYELESPEDMLEWVKRSKYSKGGKQTSEYIESIVRSSQFCYLSHILAQSTAAPVSLYAFMKLCSTEALNIVHIIEAIRYNADPSAVEKDLIITA